MDYFMIDLHSFELKMFLNVRPRRDEKVWKQL